MQRDRKSLKPAAFTLVELLVVITVIGILAALLLPVLNRAKDQGRRTGCLNNLKQFNLGLILYGGDNGDHLPTLKFGAWAWDLPYSVSDLLLQNGVTRGVLYDPGCPELNVDGLWNFHPFTNENHGQYRVIGYAMTFPGTASLNASNWNSSLVPQPMQVGNVTIPPQSPSERVLTAGTVISAPGQDDPDLRSTYRYTDIQGGYKPLRHRSSHLDGKLPAGDNLGMCDGHVEWRQFGPMVPRTSDLDMPTFWW